ncbi:MAG: hypothetical protein JO110_05735 [Acetobacteraceae bacterium]|nr:hypothetical protein [Acetobacteraceae bacterium]
MELLLLVDQVDGPPAPRATSNTGASAAFAPGDEHTVDGAVADGPVWKHAYRLSWNWD